MITYAYELMFKDIPNTLGGLIAYLPQVTKDKGFTVLSGLIKIIFGENITVYFLILALIQSVALVCIFRRYSTSYWISIFFVYCFY